MSSKAVAKPNVYMFIPNLIGYSRVILLLVAMFYMTSDPHFFVVCYSVSALLDALDGHAARYFDQCSKFGAVLDMVTDRSTTMVLITYLSNVFPKYLFWFQFLQALDLSSHYMHMYSQLTSGAASHKIISESGNRFLRLYYSNRMVLFWVCFGNEAFFIFLYLVAHKSDPDTFGWKFANYGAMITFPVFFIKQVLNAVQLWGASEALIRTDEKEWLANRKKGK